jgi:hypothetical protein
MVVEALVDSVVFVQSAVQLRSEVLGLKLEQVLGTDSAREVSRLHLLLVI